jgi:NAD(P)-dependent dehydrogenase (short-subunit alcohol dehydrogenase family)
MSKTILICGHGPGISDAVAREFGKRGFRVALVARNAARIAAAADELGKAGVIAKAFACDLGDTDAVTRMVGHVHAALGPISVLHWNGYAMGAGNLLTAPLAELRTIFDVGVFGLVAAVQAALPDLRAEQGSVLVTGGGFATYAEQVDKMVVQWSSMGLATSKAAQRKLTHLLHHKLAEEGVYAGEVVVLGLVKGTAFDAGNAPLEPADIAAAFWRLHEQRNAISVNFPA